jgi:hypothetical protein
MADKSQHPEGLPAHLLAHSFQLIKKADLNNTEPLMLRLVSHDKMKGIWKALSKKTNDPQQLIDFLEFLRLHPALEGEPDDPINILGDNSQRVVFNKIDKLLNRVINEIKNLSPTRQAEDGWRMLESTLSRAELSNINQNEPEAFKKFMVIKQLQGTLASIQQQHVIVDLLESMSLAAQYAATAPDAQLPIRRNSERAKVNWLIQALKRYLNEHFQTESPTMIANIVNVAFDLSHDSVNDSDVRKLKL